MGEPEIRVNVYVTQLWSNSAPSINNGFAAELCCPYADTVHSPPLDHLWSVTLSVAYDFRTRPLMESWSGRPHVYGRHRRDNLFLDPPPLPPMLTAGIANPSFYVPQGAYFHRPQTGFPTSLMTPHWISGIELSIAFPVRPESSLCIGTVWTFSYENSFFYSFGIMNIRGVSVWMGSLLNTESGP